LTTAEFEWAYEQIEMKYIRGKISKVMFAKRMAALGFDNADCILAELKELDERRQSE
jgi:hypothetical protein